jgi:hypothetical protein
LNTTQIDGDDLSGYNKAGLRGGAFVFTEFDEKWSAQMELCYSGKGSATPKGAVIPQKNKLNYIEIPLLGQYAVIKNVEIQFGVSGGYLFNSTRNNGDGSGYQNIEESMNKIEMTAFGGFNLTYLDPLYFNFRYSYSVFPVFTPETHSSSLATMGDHAWYNNVITLGVYYRIRGKKSR